MDNRKNTILLTVIAVATLLVAVVGATFAYFTAQGGDTSTSNASVTTSTADSSSFTTNALVLTADQDSFAEGKGNATASATGSATFTANTHDESSDFCYTVTFTVNSNSFEYGTTTSNAPELILTATKNSAEITSTISGLTYQSSVIGGQVSGAAQAAISGYDITTRTSDIVIPDAEGNTYHRITASAGATVTDNWNFTVTLVNYDWDQNYNAGKALGGTISLAKVECA